MERGKFVPRDYKLQEKLRIEWARVSNLLKESLFIDNRGNQGDTLVTVRK
jgi:hypothetical protein